MKGLSFCDVKGKALVRKKAQGIKLGRPVREDVTKYFYPSFFEHNEFDATITEGDSVNFINAVQANRAPKPAWVGPFSDTLKIKLLPSSDSLTSIYATALLWGKVYGSDSLKIHYDYGIGSYVYNVNQTWVKKK